MIKLDFCLLRPNFCASSSLKCDFIKISPYCTSRALDEPLFIIQNIIDVWLLLKIAISTYMDFMGIDKIMRCK